MVDVRKILIIFVIGVLFAILSQSIVDAVYPAPEYEDYCVNIREPKLPVREGVECPVYEHPDCEPGAAFNYEYDQNGCIRSITCDSCSIDLRSAREKYNFIVFIISSILGLIGIGIGLYLPSQTNNLNEWVATGFMLGGLLALFIGTARYYADMARFARPIIIFAELVIVLYVAYKKLKK